MLAVSMKLPPASRKASYTFRASSLAVPQPQSSPKVIVPSAASENSQSAVSQKSIFHMTSPLFRTCFLVYYYECLRTHH